MKSRNERVAIAKILDNPRNANKLVGKPRDAVKNNIQDTGLHPPLICRSLEASIEFKEEHKLGLLQLLDGEHRKYILSELGHTEADIVIWEGVTDARAMILMSTLNLHGSEDAQKRADVITELVAMTQGEVDELCKFLPETAADIEKYMESREREPGSPQHVEFTTSGRARRKAGAAVVLQVFCRDADQEKRIRVGIDRWLEAHDPDRSLEFKDAAAIEAVLK